MLCPLFPGGGTLQRCYGRPHLEVQPLNNLYTNLYRKGISFYTFCWINIATYPCCIPKLQISVYEILTPYISEAWKWYPFWAELPDISHYGDLFSKHYQQLFPLQKCSFIVQLSNHSQSNYTATCFHPYHSLSLLANLFVSFI